MSFVLIPGEQRPVITKFHYCHCCGEIPTRHPRSSRVYKEKYLHFKYAVRIPGKIPICLNSGRAELLGINDDVLVMKGTFRLVKICGNLRFDSKWKTFRRFVHGKVPGKGGKSKKVGPFPGWNYSNGISCFIYTFLVL